MIDGTLEIGVLAAFLLYVRRMYDPLDELAMFYNTYQSAAAALEKISGLLEEAPAVPEPAGPGRARRDGRSRARSGSTACRFAYTPGGAGAAAVRPAHPGRADGGGGRRDRGRQVDAGQAAGPVLRPDRAAGCCWTASTSPPSARPTCGAAVVMVTQESFLFSGIGGRQHRARPAVGDPARRSRQAADAIGAGEFIRALPEGFDTDVRKRGGRLSAGQRQLVAFARAFLADPAVLILDEATASLDIPAERAVQRALRTVLHGRTAVIIAHRLSTVAIADRVLVMEQRPDRRGRRPGRADRRRRGLRHPAHGVAGLAGLRRRASTGQAAAAARARRTQPAGTGSDGMIGYPHSSSSTPSGNSSAQRPWARQAIGSTCSVTGFITSTGSWSQAGRARSARRAAARPLEVQNNDRG